MFTLKNSKSNAFTLAEVLITLAIIGVVAAMTIPTLVANYQEKAWNTNANVFNRNLGESLRMMNILNDLKGLETTEEFVENLSKYMKVSNTCANDKLTNCFDKEVVWEDETIDINEITSAKNLGKDDWGTNVVGLQLTNGTSALVAYNPNCDGKATHLTAGNNIIVNTECVAVVFDTTGNKTPNTFGKDLRSVNVASLSEVVASCSAKYISSICQASSSTQASYDCVNNAIISLCTNQGQQCDNLSNSIISTQACPNSQITTAHNATNCYARSYCGYGADLGQ